MRTEKFNLSPPSLEELARSLQGPLAANYEESSVSVAECPDLRQAPFHLATKGLSGDQKVADVGGQPNLFPQPKLDCTWSLLDIAKAMEMSDKGSLVGAGAGPFHVVGQNCELSPNVSWEDGLDGTVLNKSSFAEIDRASGAVNVKKSPICDCALMINLFGSLGQSGPVLRIKAKKRIGSEKSFTECIRKAVAATYGDQIVSLGGAFLMKTGRANFHVMPDFPAEHDLPFETPAQLNDWLTYHEFDGPIVFLTVVHSADPGKKIGLRMEHTHGFSPEGKDAGGHYHYDIDGEEVEYEAYFNTADMLYRIEKPTVTLERDLHD